MKYYGLWNPNYTGWGSEQVQPNYFGNYVFRLVENKLENEFTVVDFINKFNTLSPGVRGRGTKCYAVTLCKEKYSDSYSVVSECLHYMVKIGKLKAIYVSVGSRTETIFKKC
jgi:hypothetical protein